MSIDRISSNTISDNGLFHLKNREKSMDRVNDELNTGKKHRLPRDGVTDVSQGLTYQTKIQRIDQYMKNINDAEGERISLSESKLKNTIDLLQRAREISVQGANGIYNADERKGMAIEIDELLKNLIIDANSKYKSNYLYSGFQKFTEPFQTLEGAVKGADSAMIKEVKYLGDNGKQLREVDNGEYISSTPPGSEVYWAEQFQIYSSINTANFRLTGDMNILIDGNKINFKAGDNIYAILDKINRSKSSVNASLDSVTGGLILKTTSPHKMELADIEGGTMLQDLGILQQGRPIGPDNYSQSASVFGGSVFDVLIGLRDSMLTNNTEDIGGRYLGAIDNALSNVLHHTAETGALSNRLTNLSDRLKTDKEAYTIALTNVEDIDTVDAFNEFKLLDYAQRVALSSMAKLSQISLMDFIR